MDIAELYVSDSGTPYALTTAGHLLSVGPTGLQSVTAEPVSFVQAEPLCFTVASGLYCHREEKWDRIAVTPGTPIIAGLVRPNGAAWWIADEYYHALADGRLTSIPRTVSTTLRDLLIAVVSPTGVLAVANGDSVDLVSPSGQRKTLTVPRAGTMVAHLRFDSDGTLWAGTDRGLFTIRGDKLVLAEGHGSPDSGAVSKSWRAPDDALWTYDGRYLRKSGQPVVEVTDGVVDVAFHGRLVWVSTYRAGVILLRPMPGEVWGKSRGMTSENVYGVSVGLDGGIWVGSLAGSIHRIGSNGKVTAFGMAQGLPGPHPWGVFAQASGRVLAAPYGHGLYAMCSRCDTFEELPLPNPEARVLAMLTAADGTLWLGTRTGLLRSSGSHWKPVSGSSQHRINVMVETDQRLFAGTDQGLARVQHDALQVITTVPPRPVNALFVDDAQRMWIGSHGHGVTIVNADTLESIASLHPDNGLPAQHPHSILQDHDGGIWISSNEGIFRISREAVERRIADEHTPLALQSVGPVSDRKLEANGKVHPAAAVDAAGNLWFATQSGLVKLRSGAIPARTPPPVVIVDAIEDSNGTRIGASQDGIALADASQPITLMLGTSEFIDPSSLSHQFRVLPGQPQWRQVSGRQITVDLPESGDHVVEIVAQDSDGQPSATVEQIPIRVSAGSPRRVAFRVIAAVIVALLVLTIGPAWIRAATRRKVQNPVSVDRKDAPQPRASQSIMSDPILAPVDLALEDPEFDVQQWASAVHMSDRQLRRRVKQVTGSTPSRWLRERRLARVHELMHSGQCKTLAEAGHRCGIESPAYLYRIYKSYDPANGLSKSGRRRLDS